MKLLTVILLCAFFLSCKGQMVEQENHSKAISNFQEKNIATLSVLNLKGKQYDKDVNYRVLSLYSLDDKGYRITSTRRIELRKNDSILATIKLPNSEDVKNFSVSKIKQTNIGFKIVVNWGGGNFFYRREFEFEFIENHFFLDYVRMSFYYHKDDKKVIIGKQITPPIPIQKFKILDYLQQNE